MNKTETNVVKKFISKMLNFLLRCSNGKISY